MTKWLKVHTVLSDQSLTSQTHLKLYGLLCLRLQHSQQLLVLTGAWTHTNRHRHVIKNDTKVFNREIGPKKVSDIVRVSFQVHARQSVLWLYPFLTLLRGVSFPKCIKGVLLKMRLAVFERYLPAVTQCVVQSSGRWLHSGWHLVQRQKKATLQTQVICRVMHSVEGRAKYCCLISKDILTNSVLSKVFKNHH